MLDSAFSFSAELDSRVWHNQGISMDMECFGLRITLGAAEAEVEGEVGDMEQDAFLLAFFH